MADPFAEARATLEKERSDLAHRIDELTIGGDVDMDYDDDFADRGSVASAQGENHILADALQVQLRQVDHALERIEEGTYGNCEICDNPIGDARLEVMPATSRCIDHTNSPAPRRTD